MLNGLDLFSGIGGISLALKEYCRPVAYCEIDPYCQGVLISRMARGDIGTAPIWTDIRNLHTGEESRLPCGYIDIVSGGFPCQDISVAGNGKGLAGERSGLFFEIARLCREIKPRFIFLENVPAITTRGGAEVVRTITEMGYDCRWCVISAASVGALHRRERWFLLGHSKHNGASTSKIRGGIGEELISRRYGESKQKTSEEIRQSSGTSSLSSHVADTDSTGCGELCRSQSIQEEQSSIECGSNDGDTDSIAGKQANKEAKPIEREERAWGGSAGFYWPFESREHWQKVVSTMGKCSDGIPDFLDRLRAMGNSVVPQQVKKAFEILMGLK